MTNEQLRLRMLSEDPEEAQLLDNQQREDFEHLERSKEENDYMSEILIAYMGLDAFKTISKMDGDILQDIYGAMAEYALNKITKYNEL